MDTSKFQSTATPDKTVETFQYNFQFRTMVPWCPKETNSPPSPPLVQCCFGLAAQACISCVTANNIAIWEGGNSLLICNSKHFCQGECKKIGILVMCLNMICFVQGCCLAAVCLSWFRTSLISVCGLARYVLHFFSFFVELGSTGAWGNVFWGSKVPCHRVPPFSKHQETGSLGGSCLQGCHGYLLSACCIWLPTNLLGTNSKAHH